MSSSPEDRYGKQLDHCLSDAAVKGCGGFVIGAVVSILLMRRRVWPAWLGTGFGVGLAYGTCEKDLNSIK